MTRSSTSDAAPAGTDAAATVTIQLDGKTVATHCGRATPCWRPHGTRLLSMWVLCCALPSLGIAPLIVAGANGWLIDKSASVEVPVLVHRWLQCYGALGSVLLRGRSAATAISAPIEQA